MNQIIEWRGKPEIRVDNGPECQWLMQWAEKRGITIEYIQPATQQNAYIERYNRTVRHEWLDQTLKQ